MSGRNENDIKNEEKAKEIMHDYPLLEEWYYSNDEKTTKGRLAYVRYIIKYFDYLKEEGYDVNDIQTFKAMKMPDINRYMNSIRYYTDKDGNKKPLGGSIRNARLAAIRSFYTYLVVVGYIENDPTAKVPNPKVRIEKEVQYLEEDDIEKIIKGIDEDPSNRYSTAMRERDKLIIKLGCRTGLRETALSEINLNDIDFVNNKILVTEKGNVTREVFVGDSTLKMIEDYLPFRESILGSHSSDALFVANRGTRISVVGIQKIIIRSSERIGKRISPHKMRSTCAVNLYDKTGDIYLVKEVLGHKNIANTQRYARVSETKRREAANILDNL